MAAVTICSDFGAPKNKVWHSFHCFPIYFPWNDGTRCVCILKFIVLISFSTYENNLDLNYTVHLGFPYSSAGKKSTCNAGDPDSIPGSGISAGEGIGYPLQYSWAFLVAQLVKNPPAMQETWVRSLDWEDPLEKGKATHSSILGWQFTWTVHGVAKSHCCWN